MKEKIHQFFKERITRFSWQRVGFTLLISLVIIGCTLAALVWYGSTFKEKTLPNIWLGQFNVGNMNQSELKSFLQKLTDKFVDDGWHFVYEENGQKKTLIISPVLVADGNSFELMHFDIKKETERLINFDKNLGPIMLGWRALNNTLFSGTKMNVENLDIDTFRLAQILADRLSSGELPPQEANVKISSINPLDFTITEAKSGATFNYDKVLKNVDYNTRMLLNDDIGIEKTYREPTITADEVKTITNKLPKIFTAGGLQLTYRDPETKREYDWRITVNQLAQWLEVKKDNNKNLYFGLNEKLLGDFLTNEVAPTINVPALNAKFKTDSSGRVVEFQGSRPGIALNIAGGNNNPGTLNLIEDAIRERSFHDSGFTKIVTVDVSRVEPNVTTGDVNDLGISEVLGVGISDYSNSPTNRIKNIKNAVNKLNGILIKPGEEFSTLKYTGPFTEEGGYFPELVIKGDEMKPEVGGGLCQIGTTLFRMAMNSGLDITERRNHSLIISHYKDPVNNLPGTDATVYDPAPDFKFLNDTDSYILIQTAMDVKNEQLIFTLWGKGDGRSGSYTHPVISQWYPAGEPKTIETTKLKPGEKQCQNAFTGADASFTYTRTLANGQVENKVFESHYRPLPKICLVGVAEVTTSSTTEIIDVPATAVQ